MFNCWNQSLKLSAESEQVADSHDVVNVKRSINQIDTPILITSGNFKNVPHYVEIMMEKNRNRLKWKLFVLIEPLHIQVSTKQSPSNGHPFYVFAPDDGLTSLTNTNVTECLQFIKASEKKTEILPLALFFHFAHVILFVLLNFPALAAYNLDLWT